MEMDQFIVSLLVANHFGVLTRISALFARRGFNIDSLTVGVTEDPEVSRMTIVTRGDEYIKDQIVKQLQKLVDVKIVQLMDLNKTVIRELLVVKINVHPGKLSEISEAVKTYRASVVDLSPDSMIIEITGEPPKLSAFLNYIKGYGIIEMARTGPTAMGRSTYCLAEE
ncbi:MAG: acetolactate synthase small subunit [Bacillota bacterium]